MFDDFELAINYENEHPIILADLSNTKRKNAAHLFKISQLEQQLAELKKLYNIKFNCNILFIYIYTTAALIHSVGKWIIPSHPDSFDTMMYIVSMHTLIVKFATNKVDMHFNCMRFD